MSVKNNNLLMELIIINNIKCLEALMFLKYLKWLKGTFIDCWYLFQIFKKIKYLYEGSYLFSNKYNYLLYGHKCPFKANNLLEELLKINNIKYLVWIEIALNILNH